MTSGLLVLCFSGVILHVWGFFSSEYGMLRPENVPKLSTSITGENWILIIGLHAVRNSDLNAAASTPRRTQTRSSRFSSTNEMSNRL
ncbi:hypothetical protein DER46DRAFT_597860 [Fusarium sp. MPI-SDFR-AT-0072]|nr:hypothetical protein DER46DRAFT_597860 [Fusarium sp. MPI-SDFR-AT-0072]